MPYTMRKQYLMIFTAFLLSAAGTFLSHYIILGPARPGPEMVFSAEAARAAEIKIGRLLTQTAVDITLTQREATSWLMQRASTYTGRTGKPAPFASLHVYFQEGTIQLYGEHRIGLVTAGVLVTLHAAAAPGGRLDVRVDGVQIGPFAAGSALLETINHTIRANLAALWGHYRVTAFSVRGGELSLRFRALP